MQLSSLVQNLQESITLKLNEKAVKLAEGGRKIFNLTAGQLPFKPSSDFIKSIGTEKEKLASYQYSPVAGDRLLLDQIIKHISKSRNISFDHCQQEVGCVVSNGGKHSLYNVVGAIVNPGDEVVVLSPYWISYPEIVKMWGAVPRIVKSTKQDNFAPSLKDIESSINSKTKIIIINSPNNPTGLHYSESWMMDFAKMIKKYPEVTIISDEIYFHLHYKGPAPTYFYQYDKELLNRTAILDGISKSFSSTGLRIGYCVAPSSLTKAVTKIQAQTASGANSLIQKALVDCGIDKVDAFLTPVKIYLKKNADILMEKFHTNGLSDCWYESVSAFYFIIDFTKTPVFAKYQTANSQDDLSMQICDQLLEETGIAGVPTTDFGLPNGMRISLVLEHDNFNEAMDKLTGFLCCK